MAKLIHEETVKAKTWRDADSIGRAVAAKAGANAYGPNPTYYVNTSETDNGLLVEVWEREE